MTLLPNEVRGECPHPKLEFLGANRDARFIRCESCRTVFVLQGGQAYGIPAVRAPERSANEPG